PLHPGVDIVGAAQEDVVVLRIVSVGIGRLDGPDAAAVEAVKGEQLERAIEDEGVADVVIVVDAAVFLLVPADAVTVVDLAGRADYEDIGQVRLLNVAKWISSTSNGRGLAAPGRSRRTRHTVAEHSQY